MLINCMPIRPRPSPHTRSIEWNVSALFATLLATVALAACGADKQPDAPSQGALVTGPTPTPTSLIDPALVESVWQTSPAAGGIPNGVAFNPTLSMRDGSEATLEQLAAGKPLLFYFHALW